MTTLSAESKWVNLERSFFKLVYDELEVGKGHSGLISYDDDLFDTTGKTKWVRFSFLGLGVRKPSFQQVQATVAARSLDSDPQNLTLKQLVDDVVEALNANSFLMYDFSDIDNPVKIIKDLGRGEQEMEAAIRLIGPNPRQPTLESGVSSFVLTYGIWLWKDGIIQ